MYTEKSVVLKNDFYSRYGNAGGILYFAKCSAVCTVLDGGTHKLMFPLECGVQAYGRSYGDILKIMDTETNICDVRFAENGNGAQILYRTDIRDLKGMDAVRRYAVDKILGDMGHNAATEKNYEDVKICDLYAPDGWCAVKMGESVESVPLPLEDYRVLLVRGRKNKIRAERDAEIRYIKGERERTAVAAHALKSCRIRTFLDMVNESENAAERLLEPSRELLAIIHATRGIAGADASKICGIGVICFCKRNLTDSVIGAIRGECENRLGYRVRISVVK